MPITPEPRAGQERRSGPVEDELLAVRCQLGEPAAFDALIARFHEPLWRYSRRVTGDAFAADDAVQEVWLRVLRGLGRLRERGKLRSWIFGIARRVLMDRFRASYASPEYVPIEADDLATVDEASGLTETIGLMQDELALLPVVEREVLTLFYLEELTLGELADVLEIPAGTVKSRLFRARRMLRSQLTKKGLLP